MMLNIQILFLMTMLCNIFCEISGFINVYRKIKPLKVQSNDDPGKPLFLTPLIEAGKIKQAQEIAQVKFSGSLNIKSYAGYLTINKKYNSNSFFWYFPSETNSKTDPVVLWLQGGPGVTSLIGVFTENGPYIVQQKNELKLRQYTWIKNHNVIYIDNPIGSGYSFTENDDGYARNETAIGLDLYNALLQFFQLFPDLQKNDFFVSGESYAGKFVPAVCYTIHTNNPAAKQKINLKGFSIGNGYSDPENQLRYAEHLYQIGIIDINAREQLYKYEIEGLNYIQEKNWIEAYKYFSTLLNGNMDNKGSYFQNLTGFTYYFNYLINNDTGETMEFTGDYIQTNKFRAGIHVGNISFNGEDNIVRFHLMEDIMQSVAPWVSELLSHYRGLIYSGQLDIIVAYPLTLNYLQNLKFSAADEYKIAPRHLWYVENELAGYSKVAGNLTEVLVRNSGHMVAEDQPKWALDLITRFTRNKLLY